MMGKKINLTLTGIVIIFLATGCINIKSPEELVRMPRSAVEKSEITRVITDFLDENKTLTLATNQRAEAVRRVDLDSDGALELFVLYKEVDNRHRKSEEYGMLILKKKKDKWSEINRIEGSRYGFDSIQYDDVTGDNKPEIFVGENTGSEIEKFLTIYSYHDGYFRNIYYSSYRDFSLGDLDNDGRQEVVLFNKEENSDTGFVEAFKYIQNELVTIDRYGFEDKSFYSTMTLGRASDDYMGIFIDHDIGTFNGYTDLLIMKNDKLNEVLRDTLTGYYQKLKGNITESKDINDDGIIEFGFITDMGLREEYIDYEVPYIKEWYQWSGDKKIIFIQREYYNYDNGYKIVIPLEWNREFVILERRDENEIGFYSSDHTGRPEDEIFSIKSFSSDEWAKEKTVLDNRFYIVLDENRERVIVGKILYKDKKSKYYIVKEKLKEIFVKI
ncbi:hypothetical protein R9X47_14875 [Wukongibacter baidiensis]|uniref:hypothetical protein n=1 Tax=Wukongibacter baidiensis TaxID=1723361 RepID=UPI003D7F3227